MTHTHCANCGRKRPRPKGGFRYVSRAEWERDPYCSRDCCEKAVATTIERVLHGAPSTLPTTPPL